MTNDTAKVTDGIIIDQDSMAGMYLTFGIAEEGYGLEIRHVTEIIGIQPVTNVPDMPEHVIGVLNLRGKVIPIIDVRLRFNLPQREYDERTCIIVVNVDGNSVGLVVDKVNEVVDIPVKDIEPPPATGKGRSQYIQGLGKIDQQVKILLDIEALIADEKLDDQITETDEI
jgi:purine-binding chemotaxis protein CheW